jgi:hypothetical protein
MMALTGTELVQRYFDHAEVQRGTAYALGNALLLERSETAALGEIVARISAAAIDPAVERAERLDVIQSILIDWLRSKQR